MFEEMFGAFMAQYGFDFFVLRRWGGCRWLMYDEMLGSLIVLLGSPGWLSGMSGLSGRVLCGKCRSPFVRFTGVGVLDG